MNINLDNYESFFLLYVDNELSAAERKEIEMFLASYPYLQAELGLLQETVLPVQQSTFAFKADLLKPVISAEMLQENLLLHLDEELAGDKKEELEQLLLKDDTLQKEWATLNKTKLDAAEVVTFADKHLLYRHERAKVITGRFVRLAVAALFIGAGFFAGITFFNRQGSNNQQIAEEAPKKSPLAKPSISAEVPAKVAAEKPGIQIETAATVPTQRRAQEDKKLEKESPEQKVMVAVVKPGKSDPVSVAKEPGLIKDKDHDNVTRISPEASDISRTDLAVPDVKHKPTALEDINMQPVENLFAKRASGGLEEEDDDDHIFMIDEDKVARTKAAGFIKKIKRTVERTTKIKPGNSLRIAGFEFAVK